MTKVLLPLDEATAQVNNLLEQELFGHSDCFDELVLPLVKAGGKRMRARLCLLLALQEDGKISPWAYQLAAAVEMLHLATLIHDDVLDEAALRRGTPTIHSKEGNKVAILSGDYLFARSFDMISRVPSTVFLPIFTDVIVSLVEGEFLQMADIDNVDQSVDRYLLKSKKKTADLVVAAIEVGARLGNFLEEDIVHLKKYGHALGMLFQITDDVLDYTSVAEISGKEAGQDLKEGLITYPLLSIVNEENKQYIKERLSRIEQGENPEELLSYVLAEGGIECNERLALTYAQEAKEELQQVAEFVGKDMLNMYVDALMHRNK